MRYAALLVGLLAAALVARPARAQTDVILRADGEEVRGRVLAIGPAEVVYVPASAESAGAGALRPAADTLRLPSSDVFLVRYANGTREVLARLAAPAAPPEGPAALAGLSPPLRQARGQRDATVHYTRRDAYWGAFGSTLYLGPLLGVVPTAAIGNSPVKASNLGAPDPALLTDPDYLRGYREQANRAKSRRAWAGFGTATGLYVLLVGALLAGAQ